MNIYEIEKAIKKLQTEITNQLNISHVNLRPIADAIRIPYAILYRYKRGWFPKKPNLQHIEKLCTYFKIESGEK